MLAMAFGWGPAECDRLEASELLAWLAALERHQERVRTRSGRRQ